MLTWLQLSFKSWGIIACTRNFILTDKQDKLFCFQSFNAR